MADGVGPWQNVADQNYRRLYGDNRFFERRIHALDVRTTELFPLYVCTPCVCMEGGGGVQGFGPPSELSSGVHAKRKNPVRIFFVEGGRGLGSH